MTTSLTDSVAGQVRAEMGRAQVSGVRLAKQLGKSHAYVSRRLRGEVAFDTNDLAEIAKVLGLDVADLMTVRRPIGNQSAA